jgi:hypothetical protein
LHPRPRIRKLRTPPSACVDAHSPGLHIACTDLALREQVAKCHRLTPSVRIAILDLARLR